MKKIKQLYKNIYWLCTTDLETEWKNRNIVNISGEYGQLEDKRKGIVVRRSFGKIPMPETDRGY